MLLLWLLSLFCVWRMGIERQEATQASVKADWSEPDRLFVTSAADLSSDIIVAADNDTDSPVVPVVKSGHRSSLELMDMKSAADVSLSSAQQSPAATADATVSVLAGHTLRSDE
jgi:hypothetical protein